MSRARNRRGRATVFGALLLVVTSAAVAGRFVPESPAANREVAAPPVGDVLSDGLGLYASALRTGDGSIDIPGTMEALDEVGANRYYYLVADSPGVDGGLGRGERDWQTLPAFADAAERADVEVVVYLVPPLQSDARTYRPYGWDYRKWLHAVGRMAKEHPAITGVAIDDFAAATDSRSSSRGRPVLTPQVIADGKAQAVREAPGLRLYAVTYSQDFAAPTARLAPFRPFLDGVIHAFSGPGNLRHAPQNTTDSGGVVDVAAFVRRTTSCAGATACQQVTFSSSNPDAALAAGAELARTFTVTGGRGRLTLDFTDDLLEGAKDAYAISVVADGRALSTSREEVGSWHRLSVDLPSTGRPVDISVRVRRTDGAGPFSLWIVPRLGDVPVTGWTPRAATGVSTVLVHPLRVVMLAYAARFGAEQDRHGAADAPYLSAVARGIEHAARSGTVDGLAVYRLNLTGARNGALHGDPANVAVVTDLFRGRP